MAPGIQFTSKKILQWAVILLGFGLDLTVVLKTGQQSLPIILCTITVSLLIAFLLYKVLPIPAKSATLIGVGSSICGGSAIAATAPVINADDEEVAQSISVIFFFNVLAAIIFPILGNFLGFSTTSGEGFGIFAGTAVNDTSSVTAAASTWDSMWGLGSATLDKAVTVKLTRTLAIIPIVLVLAFLQAKRGQKESGQKVKLRTIFPLFHPLLHPCQPHHHHRRVPWGGCQCLLPHQDPQQVFHCPGHGCHRSQHRYCQAGEDRRCPPRLGRLLLDWDHRNQPADAACSGPLVNSKKSIPYKRSPIENDGGPFYTSKKRRPSIIPRQNYRYRAGNTSLSFQSIHHGYPAQ